MSENDDPYKGEGNQNQNDQEAPKKPKKIKKFAKYDPTRSKSAPAVEDIDEDEKKEEGKDPENNNNDNGNNDYIASYNYYLYYKSLKPVDPRLPKPTYTPKANLEYIRESKKELEEDDPLEKANAKENSQLENITDEIDKLNLEPNDDKNVNNISSNNTNSNNPKNNQEDENYANFKKNYSQSQNTNSKFKNNNTNQDAPSPLLDYYSFNQQNNTHPMNNENMFSMPQIPQMPNFNPNLQMNPMNQLYGMNPGINPYSNIPSYPNMMQMSMYNKNNRNQYNNNNNKKGQKKNYINKSPDNFEYPSQMNMFPDQRFNPLYPQINPMLNMGFNSNYFQNDPNYKFMPQIAGYNKGGIIPNESSIPLNMNIPINMPLNYNLNGVDPYHQSPNMNMGMGNMYPNPNFSINYFLILN